MLPSLEWQSIPAVPTTVIDSNAANYVNEPLALDTERVETVYDGKCFRHADPLSLESQES
jgi:hypothetical protein